jgi:acetyl/propionyl-CoA carboxylase alpha subunit
MLVTINGQTFDIQLPSSLLPGESFNVVVDGSTVAVHLPVGGENPEEPDWLLVDGKPYEISLDREFRWIRAGGSLYPLELRESPHQGRATTQRRGNVRTDGRVKAPIPGLIVRVLVEPGQAVQADQPLLILEAMKMENEIRAPHSATVKSICVAAGQGVTLNEVLVELA